LTRSQKTAVALALHAGLHDRQSAEADNDKRKQLISEIERKLTEDGARPIIFYNRFAYC
jgi:peptide/nickel transport system substrate-binding protein